MSEKKLQAVLSSPRQRFAKFFHALKSKFRVRGRREISKLKRFIPDGAVIFDIGANFGRYAKAFAELNDQTNIIYCFEPVDYTRDILKATLKSYKNTKIFNLGFADKKGYMRINIPIKESGKIGPGLAHLGSEIKRDFISQMVEINTIDNFVQQYAINRLDFIKIDIEGAELLAFKGAKNTLLKFKPAIICEVNHEYMARLDLKTDDFFWVYV